MAQRYILAFMGFVGLFIISSVNKTLPFIPNFDLKIILILKFGQVSFIVANLFAGIQKAKHLLGFSVAVTSIFYMLCKYIALSDSKTLHVAYNLILPFCKGLILPLLSTVISQWIPSTERSLIGSCIFIAGPLGYLTVYIERFEMYNIDNLTTIIYTLGGIGIVWYFIWLLSFYNTPKDNPFISRTEFEFINSKLSEHVNEKRHPVPWIDIFTSVPLWTTSVSLIIYTIVLNNIFTSLKAIYMPLTLTNKSWYYLKLLFTLLYCILTSYLADWFVKNKHMSRTSVRKLSILINMILIGIYVVIDSFNNFNKLVNYVILFVIYQNSIVTLQVNLLDLCPNYTGIAVAFSNIMLGCVEYVWYYHINHDYTMSETAINVCHFMIVGAISILYIVFASGEVQKWNDPVSKKKEQENDTGPTQQV